MRTFAVTQDNQIVASGRSYEACADKALDYFEIHPYVPYILTSERPADARDVSQKCASCAAGQIRS